MVIRIIQTSFSLIVLLITGLGLFTNVLNGTLEHGIDYVMENYAGDYDDSDYDDSEYEPEDNHYAYDDYDSGDY